LKFFASWAVPKNMPEPDFMSEEEAVLNEYTWALVIFFIKWIDTEILGFALWMECLSSM
jgi:hypothetical protein